MSKEVNLTLVPDSRRLFGCDLYQRMYRGRALVDFQNGAVEFASQSAYQLLPVERWRRLGFAVLRPLPAFLFRKLWKVWR